MLGRHLQGHLLRFDRRVVPAWDDVAGLRLLLIFLLLEAAIGPRLTLFALLGWPQLPAWLRVPVLLALALALIRFVARVGFVPLGFRTWRAWTPAEKSYFIQVFVLANLVFGTLQGGRLRAIAAEPALWGPVALAFATHLVWGFYQELMYRGILQSELVRRWGAVPGILVSNLLFTFGPLHIYHLAGRTLPEALPMFAAIFAIGLFFGLTFHRSGNLIMIGVFHGVGDAWMTGLSDALARRAGNA